MLWDFFDNLGNWYNKDQDNAEGTWIVVGITAVICLVVYSGLFFGIRGLVNLASDETVISIADGCVNDRGLVKNDAPRSCFADGQPVRTTTDSNLNPPAPAATTPAAKPPAELVYDPPCGPNSSEHVCTEKIYKKHQVEGEIYTVTLANAVSDSSNAERWHQVPDYTSVEYDPCNGGDCKNETVNFCGNLLDHFNPGKKLNMILKDSNLSDYDECYTIVPTDLTYGGKPLSWVQTHKSLVPGAK